MSKFILSLDQGTTSSRSVLFNQKGEIQGISQKEFQQFFPKPGWVEHDAKEIWDSQLQTAQDVLAKCDITPSEIAAIGITNQRETTIVWDRETGEPVSNAIVWQDRRTAAYCDALKQQGLAEKIQAKTGLVIDAYFSATKLKWILDSLDGAREKAGQGELCFGTVDCWLLYKLTNGEAYATDVTNASRTMLFNIDDLDWDQELLDLFEIPRGMLPEVKSSSEIYGNTMVLGGNVPVPIAGIAGDQQAALFGQLCTKAGMAKNTYGTGCFMLMNTGSKRVRSENNLLTTVAWKVNDQVSYALEGSVFIAGAVVQWLRDGLGIIQTSAEVEELTKKVEDNGGVYFVPAFTGLGAPYWNQDARGSIFGITRGTTSSHIARAAIESICYQTMDVLDAMNSDAGMDIGEVRVDGGATCNNLLMQFQSDLLNCNVIRPVITETTALGAAFLAGLSVGYWSSIEELSGIWKSETVFRPAMEESRRVDLRNGWQRAIDAVNHWTNK